MRIARGLKMEMTLSPLPVKLSEVRRIEVVVRITNRTRRIIQLEFPTQQRLEIVLKDDSGRVVTQWSEDQYFAQSRSYLTINPREHVDYSEKMPTRDLVANRSYTLEAFLPGYAELAVRETFVPVP